MNCPSCDEEVEIEDWEDLEHFQCWYCDTWLRLEVDESTYRSAIERALVIVDIEDLI